MKSTKNPSLPNSRLIKQAPKKAGKKPVPAPELEEEQPLKQSKVEKKKKVVAGELRVRKAWKETNAKLKASTHVHEWLRNLCDLLDTPKYARATAVKFSKETGKPIEFKWKIYREDSRECCVQVGRYDLDNYPEFLRKQFLQWFEFFNQGGDPIVYSTPIDSNRADPKIRTLVVTRDYVQTGGGHNDSPTYGYVLTISTVFSIYYVL